MVHHFMIKFGIIGGSRYEMGTAQHEMVSKFGSNSHPVPSPAMTLTYTGFGFVCVREIVR